MTPRVQYQLRDGIAEIRIDDGKVNALSLDLFGELGGAFDRAKADRAVVVLSGRPGVFSAGFDLRVLRAGGAAANEMVRTGFELAERILAFPVAGRDRVHGPRDRDGRLPRARGRLSDRRAGRLSDRRERGRDRHPDAALRRRDVPAAPRARAFPARGGARGDVRARGRGRGGVPRSRRARGRRSSAPRARSRRSSRKLPVEVHAASKLRARDHALARDPRRDRGRHRDARWLS